MNVKVFIWKEGKETSNASTLNELFVEAGCEVEEVEYQPNTTETGMTYDIFRFLTCVNLLKQENGLSTPMIIIKDTSLTTLSASVLNKVLKALTSKQYPYVVLLSRWQDHYCTKYSLSPIPETMISIAEPTDGYSDQAILFSVEALNTINNNISLLRPMSNYVSSKIDDINNDEYSSVQNSPMVSPVLDEDKNDAVNIDQLLKILSSNGSITKITTMPSLFDIDAKSLTNDEIYKTQTCATGNTEPTISSSSTDNSGYIPLDQSVMQVISNQSSVQSMYSSMWWIWLVIALIVVIILSIIIAVSQLKYKKK